MSNFSFRDLIKQHILQSLSNEPGRDDEIYRIQQSKSLKDAFGFTGPGFEATQEKGQTFRGPGGTVGFLGPGFKK